MDGLLVDLRDNASITVYFDFTYSGLHRCIVFFLLIVSLLHYLAIQPSRLQVCSNKNSCQLSVVDKETELQVRASIAASRGNKRRRSSAACYAD